MDNLLDTRPTIEVLICHDASHCHRTPTQYLISGYRNGHFVELTLDGDLCNVRIDEISSRAQLGVNLVQALDFIRRETESLVIQSQEQIPGNRVIIRRDGTVVEQIGKDLPFLLERTK